MQDHKQLQQSNGVKKQRQEVLPAIPDKIYFTIGEVSKLCLLKPHVLRYWEQEFGQLHPTKRRGNRRYYQRKDVLLVRKIKNLLYEQGFTIDGARVKLGDEDCVVASSESSNHEFVKNLIKQLEDVVTALEAEG